MKCSSFITILSIILNLVSSLIQKEGQPNLDNKRAFYISESYLSAEAPTKRSSRNNKNHYSSVNVPVPARAVPYTNKPDVYINHVHVHNGG